MQTETDGRNGITVGSRGIFSDKPLSDILSDDLAAECGIVPTKSNEGIKQTATGLVSGLLELLIPDQSTPTATRAELQALESKVMHRLGKLEHIIACIHDDDSNPVIEKLKSKLDTSEARIRSLEQELSVYRRQGDESVEGSESVESVKLTAKGRKVPVRSKPEIWTGGGRAPWLVYQPVNILPRVRGHDSIYGYRREPRGKYSKVPYEQKILDIISADRESEHPSPKRVAAYLNEQGYRTRTGRLWTPVAVQTVFTTYMNSGVTPDQLVEFV